MSLRETNPVSRSHTKFMLDMSLLRHFNWFAGVKGLFAFKAIRAFRQDKALQDFFFAPFKFLYFLGVRRTAFVSETGFGLEFFEGLYFAYDCSFEREPGLASPFQCKEGLTGC